MRMAMRLIMCQLCSLCGRMFGTEQLDDEKMYRRLYGSSRYSFCPCCGGDAEDRKDEEWRRKVDAFLKERRKKDEKKEGTDCL